MRGVVIGLSVVLVAGCGRPADPTSPPAATAGSGGAIAVADTPSEAQAADGRYVSWREHRIDDTALGGVAISGSEGLVMADLDLDGDGRLEVVASNKGGQNPPRGITETHPLSWFALPDDPLDGEQWVEHELSRVIVPINAQPVDLDGDGDLDVVGGSRMETRIFWFENVTVGDIAFVEHRIDVEPEPSVTGFNMDYVDLSGDGRLDIVLRDARSGLIWIEQPAHTDDAWDAHLIGDIAPDVMVGFVVADIDDDGRPDVMTGAYSQGARDHDADEMPESAAGRLAWFRHPEDPAGVWTRHDVSRRRRGMFDTFIARDMDTDGDLDFVATRGNSDPYDGVFWLEQVRTAAPVPAFEQARPRESVQLPLPY